MPLLVFSKQSNDPAIDISKRVFRNEGSNVPSHRHHNFYEIEFIISGTCIYEINGIKYQGKEGSCFLTTPLDVHSVDVLRGKPLIYNIRSLEYFVLPEYQNILFNTKIHSVQFKNTEKICTLFELLLNEFEKRKDHFSEINQKQLLNLIIAEFIRNAKISDTGEKGLLISEIVRYIRIHISDPLTLENVAKSFNLSNAHLSRLFKKHMGTTFKRYIIDLRLDLAKNLLTSTDMPVTSVCYDTGFTSICNFLKRFKEKLGCTPNEYRNLHKK